jgi:hypothetical protein
MRRPCVAVLAMLAAFGITTAVGAIHDAAGEAGKGRRGAVARATPEVSPSTGRAPTTFVIRFRSRARLGRHRSFALRYDLDVFEGNRHPVVGCVGSFSDVIRHGEPGERLSFREAPGPLAPAGWCPAGYRGTIRLVETHPCRTRPAVFECRPRTRAVVGRVSWRVRRG